MTYLKRIAALLLGLLLIGVAAYLIWLQIPFGETMPQAQAALQNTESVVVLESDWLSFFPTRSQPQTGFIFYPPAKVAPEAYAPLMQRIAEAGYLGIIAYPPLGVVLLNPNLADPIIRNHSAVKNWAIGGHSLGGIGAIWYTESHPDTIDGVALLASRPWGELQTANFRVLSIYGTNDGIFTPQEFENSLSSLPDSTRIIRIEGGNHSQFGYYGLQSGDNPAAISREEQIQQTAAAIITLLEAISEQPDTLQN